MRIFINNNGYFVSSCTPNTYMVRDNKTVFLAFAPEQTAIKLMNLLATIKQDGGVAVLTRTRKGKKAGWVHTPAGGWVKTGNRTPASQNTINNAILDGELTYSTKEKEKIWNNWKWVGRHTD